MKPISRLYHLARADFYERVRRHGFFVALLFCVYAGYALLPPATSRYVTLSMDSHRGVYNSAYIGTAMSMLCGAFISLIGFFIVKNAVERDRRTGVGQILATTPVSKVQYTIGKTLSNFAVLAAMTGIVALACIVMQFLRAEDRQFDAWQLFSPFILLTLPTLLLVSAVAVCFETMPVLRGGIGNVAFIFVWGGLLGNFGHNMAESHNDPLGTGIVIPELFRACKAAFPNFDPLHAELNMGVNIREKGEWSLTTYPWDGMRWTAQHVLWRLEWVVAAFVLAGIAAIPFDRFDTTGIPLKLPKKRKRWKERVEEIAPVAGLNATDVRLTPLNRTSSGTRRGAIISGAMTLAEWKLIVRGLRWWYAGPLGLTIAALTVPLAAVHTVILPLAWFWPVLQWSKLGTREAVHNTEPVFFSAPHPLSRQLLATWVAGVMLSVMTGFAMALRFAMAGDAHALVAWCVGAAFIPALALALGVWTRSGKAFEAIYTGLCYAVIQQAAPLDFMGAVPAASRSNPAIFGLLTLLFLLLAIWGRQRRLRN